jgi:Fe-S cluster biogenesis protein NfuA
MSTSPSPSFDQRVQQIEGLVAQIESSPDPKAQAAAREMVRVLLDLHAAGLARILDLLAQAGDGAPAALEACKRDDLVSSLLLLHGLHPEGLETRVRRALDKVRPYLHSHGGDVELLGISEGTVRLHLEGSCHGCPSSQVTLQTTIERAIYEAAPDVVAIEVDGLSEPEVPVGLVQLDLSPAKAAPASACSR